jgi:iron(III) transport system substrate-binding protein
VKSAIVVAVWVGIFGVGCLGGQSPAPTGGPPVQSTAPNEAGQAAVAGAEWDAIVAAAKREGRLAILGPVGTELREGLLDGFARAYPEIRVDFSGARGAEVTPKLLAELSAGQYLTDLVIAGTTTIVGDLMPANVVVPIRPYLTGPEARNEARWRGGQFDFGDDAEQYNLVFANRLQTPFMYNPNQVDVREFRSWKDMLNPRWKGKIVMLDPRRPGGGLDRATYWYTTEGLGKPFLQAFFAHDVLLLNDDRQILDFVARGQYALGVGPSGVVAYEMRQKGLPLELSAGEALQEGTYLTASNASIGVVVNHPHPNAVKVFLNHLLSQQTQTEYSKATGLTSLRTDVPRDHLLDAITPKDGVSYQLNYKERYVKLRDEVRDYLLTLAPN